jgi:hypothetical protein
MDRPFISCCRPWLPKLHKSLRVLLRHMVSGYRESIAQAEGARGHELLQYLSIVAARTAWRTACPACLSKMPMLAGGSLGPPRPLFRLRPLPTLNRAPETRILFSNMRDFSA